MIRIRALRVKWVGGAVLEIDRRLATGLIVQFSHMIFPPNAEMDSNPWAIHLGRIDYEHTAPKQHRITRQAGESPAAIFSVQPEITS